MDGANLKKTGMNNLKEQLGELTEQQRKELLSRVLLEKKKQPRRFPLSFAQQRLWFLHQMGDGSPAYHVPTALRLRGGLDIPVLERCFGEVARRHESLRTTFEANPITGTPEQVIHPWTPFTIELFDLSDEPLGEGLKHARARANHEAQRPFNLSTGPLLRASLISLASDDHVLILVIHHIVSDMWSTQVLTRELILLYEAYSRDEEPTLAELPIQYADFAHWQRNRMKGDVLDHQLSYWRNQLRGQLPMLELPTRAPRPPRHTINGAEISWRLDLETTERLNSLSQREGATLFMTLLAAFNVLLMRYSSQQDILIGTPISNRNRAELEPLIGLFINTLVLRTDLSGEPSFQELLRRVKEVAVGAYANQEVPFEKLVEELQPERDLARTPLFQVMFALQNVPQQNAETFSLSVSPFDIDVRTSKFDLTLTALEDGQGLLGVCEYNTDLFDEQMIERMIGHYKTLLASILADPDRAISRLLILTQIERATLLFKYEEATGTTLSHSSLHELFEAQVARAPKHTALIFEEKQLTYGELNRRANKLAHYLRSLGVGPETLVGIFVERSALMVVGLLGILKAGGAYVPLDPAYPQDRLAFIVNDAGIKVLLTERDMLESLPAHQAELICLDADWEKMSAQPETNPDAGVRGQNLAYVIYTSGSTGKPKGALVTHENVLRLFSSTHSWFVFGPGDVWTLFHSYAFDFSVWEIWGALLYGGRLIVVPYLISRSPESFYKLLRERQVTVLNQTPSAFRQLMQVDERSSDEGDLSLRLVIFGGEALDIAGLKPWFERHGDKTPQLVNMYGITETTVHVTYRPLVKEDLTSAASLIGVQIPDLQFYILDSNLEPLPQDVPGEVYVGGAGVSRGYLNRPELTAERFIPDPFDDEPGARLYKTGDSARRLSNGDIEYLGRIDQQVKIRGFRIELGEIEATLLDHPSVSDAVVIAKDTRSDEKQVVAYIVQAAEEALNVAELRGFLKKKLPDYMIPSHFITLYALPLTPNGKIDRRALPDPQAARPDIGAIFIEARTPIEKILAEIWAETLHIPSAGIDDNFFELGGDSILSVQVLSKAQKRGVTFTIAELFEHQTIRELAHNLDSKEERDEETPAAQITLISDSDRRRLPDGVEDAYPLTMLQTGMLFHSSLEPEAAVYHNIGSYHLRAPFDLDLFRTAVERLFTRHPVLRTSFDMVNYSEPVQLVHRTVQLPLEVEDLRGLSTARQEEAIQQWIESEKRKQFDSARPPLIRFHVHRRTDSSFQFGMTEHHAILDGWSVATVLTELFQTYFSLLRGEPDPGEAPCQSSFRDFVILEREALASEESRTYWSERLRDSTITKLPRWPSSSEANARKTPIEIDVPISLETSEALKRAAAIARAPLKSVLLSAHLKLISLLSSQTDVMTGVVTHGRPEGEDGERVLGLFLNTLPFRQTLDGGTWAELAKQTFDNERELMPFRYYPMAQIQRDAGAQPLFDTVFNFTHFHVFQELDSIGDLEILGSSLFAQTNLAFWANFSMDAFSPVVKLTVSGDAGLFCREQMELIAGYYASALETLASNPHQNYNGCDLLSEQERSKLLVDWNDTRADYPQAESINQLFEAQVERAPDSIAVACGSERLTFRELNRRANQLARHLRLLGAGPETRVGICLERSSHLLVGLLGILKAGGAYVPLDIGYPRERVDFMLADSRISILVTQHSLADRLQAPERALVCLDTDSQIIGAQDSHNLEPNVTAGNLAYVIYTSGSTGRPKGVAIEHRSALAFLHWARDIFSPDDCAGMLASTSICFDLSVFEFFFPLSMGGKIILVENALHLTALEEDANVTFINTVPSAMTELTRSKAIPKSVRTVNLAGEPLRNKLAQTVYEFENVERVFNLYGPSEDTTYSTFTMIERGASVEPTIGRPVSNTQAYILDRYLRPCPVGVAGELHLSGAGLARCYINRPALSAERFIPNPFSDSAGARIYKTGDLARFLPGGDIEFLGRFDHQVKIRGFRIELGEVESVLSNHAEVREVVVLDTSSSSGDKELIAYVVPSHETPLTAEILRSYLREKLPDYMIPPAFVFLNALPLTPNGKIDRRALRLLETSSDESKRENIAPRDLLEFQLVQIWENLLDRRPISITDNFFELGGHSLLAVRLAAQVLDRLNRTLPLSALVQGASIESLARLLRQQAGSTQASTVVAIQPEGPKTPFFCVHPVGGNILCYVELARSIGRDRPFYGLQSAGLNGEEGSGFARIEDIATRYIEAIRSVQPAGPYLLGGWSFGGVVAFEMARQLKEQSRETAHVALLDSWAPASRPTPSSDRLSSSDLAARFLADIAGISGKDLTRDFDLTQQLAPQEQLRSVLEQAISLNILPADMKVAQLELLFNVFERNARAFLDYSPRNVELGSRIVLFRASDGKSEELDGPTLGWNKYLSDQLEVRNVTGNHYSMLASSNARALGEQLSMCLDSLIS
jgi:amino acid adenylation domain-containing protein